MKQIYIFVLAIFFTAMSYGQVGKLDKSFGNGGIVITPLSSSNDAAFDVAIQDDNKVVVVGSGDLDEDYYRDAFVIRYFPDGEIDVSFGTNGRVTPKLGSRTSTFVSVIIQPDGKILAGGTSYNMYGGYDFTLIRLNKNGTPDKSFGTNGKVTTAFGADDWLSGLKLLPDGKILAVGSSGFLTKNTTSIAKYNADGSLDYSFGDSGKVQFTDAGGGRSIDVLPNGDYIVAGAYIGYPYSTHGYLKSITPSGALNTSFGNNGTTVLPEMYSISNVVALPNGKIICGGAKEFDDSFYKHKFTLYRFNANGLYDNSFGINGIVTTVLDSVNNLDRGGAIRVAPNGDIVQSGSSKGLAALLRYKYNGTLNGVVTTDAGGDSSYIAATAFQKDFKKLVACGNILTGSVDAGQDVAVLRYHSANNRNGFQEEPVDVQITKQNRISIYPNPVKGKLILEGLDTRFAANVSLRDQAGNVVFRETTRNVPRKELNLEAIRSGIYFLHVEENGKIFKFHIIKE